MAGRTAYMWLAKDYVMRQKVVEVMRSGVHIKNLIRDLGIS